MNIVFIFDDDPLSLSNLSQWRGFILFEAIKKTELHNVALLGSTCFSLNNELARNVCQDKQLLVIEGSPNTDLLNTISYWKTRGKVVVVDIPLAAGTKCKVQQKSSAAFSIQTKANNTELDQSQKFHWGLHLADAILVSSVDQQDQWQVTASVRIIPDYIDIDFLRDFVKVKHKEITIGMFGELTQENNAVISKMISNINSQYPNVKWLNLLNHNQASDTLVPKSNEARLPTGTPNKWPTPLMFIDACLLLSSHKLPGQLFHTLLELMLLKIPWISNDAKGFQEMSRYGLVVQEDANWEKTLFEMIRNLDSYIQESQDGPYLFAISRNIDDHINEILSIFNEFVKVSK